MARVLLENVSKTFSGPKKELINALRDVSFAVEEKEFLVVVGPSGSGKSTLLRLIAGLERIDAGRITIDSVVVNDVEPKDRGVAMVFQNFALYPHMTVSENLAFPLKLRKVSRAEINQRVKETGAMLGLLPCFDRFPKSLSGGERQRVALGRAIVLRPKVFLLDEPLSNLDAQMRVQMRTELTALHRQLGATMIYVTHDQVEAMTLGDRVAVLRQGAVQQISEPLALYNTPANLFVARFIGSPSMNVFQGRLVEKSGRSFFEVKDDAASRIELPMPELSYPVQQTGNGSLLLGLRPERISLVDSSAVARAENTINAHVQLVESLGADTYIHATAGSQGIIARAPGDTRLVKGQNVTLAIDLSKAHFFDPVTEERLQVQDRSVS